MLKATGGEYPDVVFLSLPCKGFSGLLPSKKAESRKYQALNNLVIRGLSLAMDAFYADLPSIIMLENVPRITSRGKHFLQRVKRLLQEHGYIFHEGYHDCGELGGLGQRRRRYLLIARNQEKVTNFIYQPPRKKLLSIGDVLEKVPPPAAKAIGEQILVTLLASYQKHFLMSSNEIWVVPEFISKNNLILGG